MAATRRTANKRIRTHARSLLLDTNLWILLAVGRLDALWIRKHPRVSAYSVEDYELLHAYVSRHDQLVTTPHILTEVSNLLIQKRDFRSRELAGMFRALVQASVEVHVPGVEILARHEFLDFGLTDLGIERVAAGSHVVLTADSALAAFLAGRGVRAVDFKVLRSSTL